MPIYEYRCSACGHPLEALQKMTDAPLRKCPDCGKSQLKRLVSAPQFRLKGSGWYETDFKNKDEKKRNLVEAVGGEPADGAAKGDTGGDGAGKPDAGKEAAVAKADGVEKTEKPKPDAAKSGAPAKKPAKARATKAARA
jgi:putative FmdB family regulatory protein